MGFTDYDTALRMREALAGIAESVVNRLRPEDRIATVVSVSRWRKTAAIKFPGETNTFDARYGKLVAPAAAGDVVKVYLRNGTYWITEILESTKYGSYVADPVLFKPHLGGGIYNSSIGGTYIGFDAPGVAVAVGDCYNLGAFSVQGGFSGSALMAEIFWIRGFFTSQSQRWKIHSAGNDPDGDVWKVVLPYEESGVTQGQGIQLEAKSINNKLYLRMRRKIDNGATWGGMGYGGMWLYGDTADRDSSVGWADTVTDTEPTAIFGDVPGGNSENNIFSGAYLKGPYFDTEKEIVQRRLQQNILGGGAINWDGVNLSWGQPFSSIIGWNNVATNGYLLMNSPAIGETVYVHGNSIGTNLTLAAASVPMNNGSVSRSALYYDPPLRGTGAYVANRYHLVSNIGRFQVPSHWVLIAVMDVSGGTNGVPSLKLATGIEVDHWRAPTLLGTWVNYTLPTYPAVGYRVQNGVCYLRGLVKSGAAGSDIFVLPAGYRPATGTHLFSGVDGLNTAARIDVDGASGRVFHQAGNTGFISLNGIRFPVEQ